jgi:hypothetical protein
MAYTPFFIASERRNLSGKNLPLLSHAADSVRTYGFEVTFYQVPVNAPAGTESKPLTLACKSVSPIAWNIEEIVADRVNDKFFYPGKATPDPVTMIFDNLFATKTSSHLFDWFSTIYNPVTGQFTIGLSDKGVGSFKVVADVVELNTQGQPFTFTRMYGLWPTGWKEGERSWASNEFHTIEGTFRFDFAVKYPNSNT